MISVRGILAPHFFFRPRQIWRRLRRQKLLQEDAIRLAWGLPVRITQDWVGMAIASHGVFDRGVPEAISRLLDSGENAVDAGASIGQNTSMMALASECGQIFAFEPHPAVFELLLENRRRWAPYRLAQITLINKALSSNPGTSTLHESVDVGGSSLEIDPPEPPTQQRRWVRHFPVDLVTLDAFLPEDTAIALMKLDVEGHEAALLRGASRLIAGDQPRDVIYEDYYTQPSKVTRMLEQAGFTVFGLVSGWSRPSLVPWRRFGEARRQGELPSNFLATRMPGRARERFRSPGWVCLRRQARLSGR